MEKSYRDASRRFGWTDNPVMRKRWKAHQEHKKRCREKAKKTHALYVSDREAWNAEISKLKPEEQTRQRKLEALKESLLAKLKR